MKLGMVGLGRMGGNMAARLRDHGHDVLGFARSLPANAASIDDLVAMLPESRRVWTMVPAGAATEGVVNDLGRLLTAGDVVVDGSNSHYRDSIRRAEALASAGIGFVDAGVSGGVHGREHGYCLMVGGDANHVAALQPIFDALCPPDGFVHTGGVGTGHFTKMVHNGIEYGLMQAYAEGYELLAASGMGIDPAGVVDAWRHGSVVRSWLLDLLADALHGDPTLESIRGWADDSGEGRWTVEEAVGRAVPVPVISAALFARFVSRQDDSPAMKVVAALRQQFGGHQVRDDEEQDR